jgi:AcrR family transcriptional regulator
MHHNGRVLSTEPGEVSSTRSRILQIALSLMSQRGVDGTSMRDLAAAANLNVASLYHYFPSKRDLLEAVLVEHGFLPMLPDRLPMGSDPAPDTELSPDAKLSGVLTEMLLAMLDVEDFVRLMVGEAIRGEETARAVGVDLFTSFQQSLEGWITEHRPDLATASGAPAVARLLRAMVVGIFVEHAAGVLVLGDEEVGAEGDAAALMTTRAVEAAQIFNSSRFAPKDPKDPNAPKDPKDPKDPKEWTTPPEQNAPFEQKVPVVGA